MIDTIKALFPNALINSPHIEKMISSHHIFYIEETNIAIEKKSLSEKELALLQLLMNTHEKNAPINSMPSFWQNFLEKKSTAVPIVSGNIQFIHLDIRKQPKAFDYSLWFKTLKEAIPNIIDYFSLNERRHTLILKIKKNEDLATEQLNGVIQTLDADFDTVTRAILGFIHSLTINLPNRYAEELDIIEQSFQLEHLQIFTTLSATLLQHLGKQHISTMPILAPLKQIIMSNSEYVSLIQALFDNQGHLSQTAEQLYIHRNTLTYRLQKFSKETGMQLQSLPDLLICYLCLA